MSQELLKATIEVNGKKYTLQHPGNREWMRLRKTLYNPSDDMIDQEPLLDYFFENCCFPDAGEKLTLDTVPLEELEDWASIALRFLRGVIKSGYILKKGRERTR